MFRREFLPPITQLVAFESAARLGSISRASNELHLTQGAVSRQIQALEDQLGVPLFHRAKQRIVLTDAGRAYLPEVRAGLQSISSSTERVMALGGAGEVLNIAVLPTFGTLWLIPRLSRFLAVNQGITVNFSARTEPFDFELEPFDAAIHFGEKFWPGAECEYLFGETVIPVCSPDFQRRNKITSYEQIGQFPLLHQESRPSQWAEFFSQVGVKGVRAMHGPRYEHFSMLFEAVSGGIGVALLPRFMIERDLAAGRLVQMFPVELTTIERAYYIVVPHTRTGDRLVQAFRDWVVSEARHTREGVPS